VLTGHAAVRCEGKILFARAESGEEVQLPFDELIVAVGRKARLTGYGLEDLGIETNKTVVTNDYLETIYPNIFAAGDVAGPYQFTHVAAHQAWFAAVNALFGTFRKFRADYRVVPWVTYTEPEVAHVGHNELSAAEADVPFEIVRYELGHLDRAVTESANEGFIKLLVQPGKDRILGATIVSHNAGELLAPLVLAMKHGLGLNKILGTITLIRPWPRPTNSPPASGKRRTRPNACSASLSVITAGGADEANADRDLCQSSDPRCRQDSPDPQPGTDRCRTPCQGHARPNGGGGASSGAGSSGTVRHPAPDGRAMG
jgi:hypothetical protein